MSSLGMTESPEREGRSAVTVGFAGDENIFRGREIQLIGIGILEMCDSIWGGQPAEG